MESLSLLPPEEYPLLFLLTRFEAEEDLGCPSLSAISWDCSSSASLSSSSLSWITTEAGRLLDTTEDVEAFDVFLVTTTPFTPELRGYSLSASCLPF